MCLLSIVLRMDIIFVGFSNNEGTRLLKAKSVVENRENNLISIRDLYSLFRSTVIFPKCFNNRSKKLFR